MKTKIGINIIYSITYQILIIILPLIITPYVSRVLGSGGIGEYAYTYNISSCFALVGMMGINLYGCRAIASNQDNREAFSREFWSVWCFQLTIAMLTVFTYIIYVFFIGNDEYRLLMILNIFCVLTSVIDINWFFYGLEKVKLIVLRNIIVKILSLVCIFSFVKNQNDVWIYTLIITFGQFTSALCIWPFMKREVDFIKPDIKSVFKHLKGAIVLFLPVLAVSIYKRMDKIMIGFLSSMEQLGFYENAEKIITVPMCIITAIGTVMLPRMTQLFSKGKSEEISKYISISIELITCFSIALCFGISGISQEFSIVFFGVDFDGIWILISVLAITIPFIAWANVIRTQYLLPAKCEKIYIVACWIGAIINLAMNFVLIPNYGATGAAIATVITEIIVAIIQTYYVKNKLPVLRYVLSVLFYIFVGVIMYIIVRKSGELAEGLNSVAILTIQIIVGAIIYISMSLPYFLKRHKKDITILKKI